MDDLSRKQQHPRYLDKDRWECNPETIYQQQEDYDKELWPKLFEEANYDNISPEDACERVW